MRIRLDIHHHFYHHYPEIAKMEEQMTNIEREAREAKEAALAAGQKLDALRADVNAQALALGEKTNLILDLVQQIAALTETSAEYEALKARLDAAAADLSDATDTLVLKTADPAPAPAPEPEAPVTDEPAPGESDTPADDNTGADPASGQQSLGEDDPPPPPPADPPPAEPVDPGEGDDVKTSDKHQAG